MRKGKNLTKKNRKKMLLHCCCGPCSSNVTGELLKDYEVTLFYYNPCIFDLQEYNRRLDALKVVANYYKVKLIVVPYNQNEFYEEIIGFEQEKEGGSRCNKCIFQRLKATCFYAKQNGFDIFTTTLSVSPHKKAEVINDIGSKLSKESEIDYLESNFKKNNGFLKSIEMSKKLGLYRQNYCGCKFSMKK